MADFTKMTDLQMFQHDEEIFKSKINAWTLNNSMTKYVVLDNGIGDHYAFKSILPEVLQKYPNIILALCYPAVFDDYPNIPKISIAQATQKFGNLEQWSVYKLMSDNNWNASLIKAFRKMYLYAK
jgi:hypothetical protein